MSDTSTDCVGCLDPGEGWHQKHAARLRRRRLWRAALGVATLLALSLCARLSAAQAPQLDPCHKLRAEAETAAEPTRLPGPGDEAAMGMWFPMPTARLMLCEVRELRLRRDEIRLVDRELQLWRDHSDLLRERLGLALEAKREMQDVVAASERRASAAEEALDHWSRQPWFWLGLSAIVGGLGIGFGVWLAGE